MRRTTLVLCLGALALLALSFARTRPDTIDSSRLVVAGSGEMTSVASGNVYEPLVELDERLQPGPGLARSWYNPDPLTWVFELEPAVRFHDGHPLAVADVAVALENARKDELLRGLLAAVESIEARGNAVVIRTSHPFGPLARRLGRIPIERPAPGARPAGTGPFRVLSWSSHREFVLEGWDGYRKGRPAVASVEFRSIPDSRDQLALLREGRIHLALDVPRAELAALRGLPSIRTVVQRGGRVLFLGMNVSGQTGGRGARNPFHDVRVREAVALAVDRARLVSESLGGLGEVATQLAVPEVFGHHDRITPYPFDPAESRRLLAAAGYEGGFSVDLDYTRHAYRDVAAIVASVVRDLDAVGIRVRLRPQERLLNRLERGDTAFYLTYAALDSDIALTYEYYLHTRRDGYGGLNAGGYSSATVDAWLEQAAREPLPQRRGTLLRHIAEQIRLDVPLVPLVVPAESYALDVNLDFHPRIDRQVRLGQARWKRPPAKGTLGRMFRSWS